MEVGTFIKLKLSSTFLQQYQINKVRKPSMTKMMCHGKDLRVCNVKEKEESL
jgi:hypothetical protein